MYSTAYLTIGNFEALLSLVQFVYKYPTTVGIRKTHWSILVQTAGLYTIMKYFKKWIKDKLQLYMYTASYLIIRNFDALLYPVQFMLRYPTTVAIREVM